MTRSWILDELERIKELALSNCRSYANKRGEVNEVACPDYRAAIEAIKTMAQIKRYLGSRTADAVSQVSEDELVARAERAIQRIRGASERRAEQSSEQISIAKTL